LISLAVEKKLSIIRLGKHVEVGHLWCSPGEANRPIGRPTRHARQSAGVFVSCQSLKEGREHLIPFADHRIVDPRQGTHVLEAHLVFEVGPTEHGDERREAGLEPARKGQRGAVLLEN